jgi:peptide/nickel transport system substrate-binding protein
VKHRSVIATASVVLAASLLVATSGATGTAFKRSARSSTAAQGPLVIETAFNLATADPGRMFEFTGQIIDRAAYSTLLTYTDSNLTLKPDLASKYTVSPNGDSYTFTLDPKAVFSDGNPVTAADVLFSFQRLENLQGNPSFLLAGVKVAAPSPTTVVLTTKTPNPAIPEIVTNPALGVLEASVVEAHGGTDAANAATADKAETWLNSNSAGSGPYTISEWNVNGPVKLTANPKYWGPHPKYADVVIQNAQPEQQKLDVEAGSAQIALDLSPDQAQGISNATVTHEASTFTLYTSLNSDPSISTTTSNPKIVQAVKDAIGYAGLVNLAGTGAKQAPSLIPGGFAGSLSQSAELKQDVAAAKKLVATSGVANPSITISFADDNPVNGLQLGDVAARLQSDLQAVGVTVKLLGQPVATATQLRRAGKAQEIINYWGPDYPDANDYLPFVPGGSIAEQVHWDTNKDPKLAADAQAAATAVSVAKHGQLWQQVERSSNAVGPIIPLVQPAQVLVTSKSITKADSNPAWRIDIASVR